MPHSLDFLRNIIVCDDIREEVGGKHSLMGVLGGDIVVADMPASIFMAFYMQYFPPPDEGGRLLLEISLKQDDTQIMRGKLEAPLEGMNTVNFVLPRALVIFEKECVFKMFAKLGDDEDKEIARKRIIHRPVS